MTDHNPAAFFADLRALLNRHGYDARLGLPDVVLGSYIVQCLSNLEMARMAWDQARRETPVRGAPLLPVGGILHIQCEKCHGRTEFRRETVPARGCFIECSHCGGRLGTLEADDFRATIDDDREPPRDEG